MKKLTTDLRNNAPQDEAAPQEEEETVIDGIEEEEKEEEKRVNLRLTIHTSSRESTRVPMGEMTIQQANHCVTVCNAPFDALAPNKGLVLTDAKGVTHIFNGALITHIEVETE